MDENDVLELQMTADLLMKMIEAHRKTGTPGAFTATLARSMLIIIKVLVKQQMDTELKAIEGLLQGLFGGK